MRERPILFSAPMVRAILDGRKTQTRRVVKPRHDWHVDEVPDRNDVWRNWPVFEAYVYAEPETIEVPCPYGEPGDRLWVRETWRVAAWRCNERKMALDYRASPEEVRTPWLFPSGMEFSKLWQQSSEDAEKAKADQDADGEWKWERGQSPCRWRPRIFMPRWASRIALEVTAVRVERLQEISEDDAKAEGVEYQDDAKDICQGWLSSDRTVLFETARRAYEDLWQSINGEASWAANPWVWVVEFRRLP